MDIISSPRSFKAAEIITRVVNKMGSLLDAVISSRRHGPDDCRTAEELLDYAYQISATDPGFSADLIAAINRRETE